MQQKELAQLLDISPAMVSRLAKRGMPTDTLERAERWRKRHLEPGRVKGSRFGTGAAAQTKPGGASDVLPENLEVAYLGETEGVPGDPESTTTPDYLESRSRREAAEAEMAEIRLSEQRGEVIRLDIVKNVLSVAFSMTREALLQIPDRLATTLAADSNPVTVHETLSGEIHDALHAIASASDKLTPTPI